MTEQAGQLPTAQQTIAALQAEVERLKAELPFNPRIIDASAFLKRITTEETFALFSSDDPTTQQIAAMLKAYKSNDWPIVLDDQQVVGAMSYLHSLGLLTEERKTALLSNASREEAYEATPEEPSE